MATVEKVNKGQDLVELGPNLSTEISQYDFSF